MLESLAAIWALLAFQFAPCQAPSGFPCFTLAYEHSVWELVTSPVRDMVTASVAGTLAVRADGSFLHRIQPTSRFAVRGSKDTQPPSTRLFLAATQQLLLQGPSSAEDFRLPSFFFLNAVDRRRSAAGDDGCRDALTGFAQGLERLGTANLLGEPVVNWKFKSGYGDATASLAPALACQILRMELVDYRYSYLPVRKELFEAKTLDRGEPAAKLFVPPSKGK